MAGQSENMGIHPRRLLWIGAAAFIGGLVGGLTAP